MIEANRLSEIKECPECNVRDFYTVQNAFLNKNITYEIVCRNCRLRIGSENLNKAIEIWNEGGRK